MYVGMYMMMMRLTKMTYVFPLPVIAARRAAAVPPPEGRPPCRRLATAANRRPEGGRRRPEGGRRVAVRVSRENASHALCFLAA